MRITKFLLLILLASSLANTVKAQDSTKMAKVYFVRSTGYNGSLLVFHCFVDSSLVCALNNNQYSVHWIDPGEHTLNINAHSKSFSNNKKSIKLSAVAGQSYYIKISPVQGYDNKVAMLSVSENTIRPVLKKCELKTNCLD